MTGAPNVPKSAFLADFLEDEEVRMNPTGIPRLIQIQLGLLLQPNISLINVFVGDYFRKLMTIGSETAQIVVDCDTGQELCWAANDKVGIERFRRIAPESCSNICRC